MGAGNFRGSFPLDQFIENFKGGLRQYMFFFIPSFPNFATVGGMNTSEAIYLVRATNTPEANFEQVIASWQGYDYKAAGRKTYNDFTVTFNSDVDGKLFKTFHKWNDGIRAAKTGVHKLPNDYMVDQHLQLLHPTDPSNVVIEFTLIKAWPAVIGPISLDYAGNEVGSFDVTFTYQRFDMEGVTE